MKKRHLKNQFDMIVLSFLAVSLIVSAAEALTPEEKAQQILDVTGVKGGIIVHIGCGDGTLTAALRANDSYVVHGLDADPCNIKDARAHIQLQELYGEVSVEQFDSNNLPYIDNLVNLVVSENLGGISMAEVMRVLAPEGVAHIWNGSSWDTTPKPRPTNIDEWTHYLHDASGNAVADDTVVGHPHRLQWVGGVEWGRNHEFLASTSVVVSSGGRVFYIQDEALPTTAFTPKWTLVAVDAFNGTPLWKKPLPSALPGWERHLRPFRSGPTHVHRRLVAIGDRVYVTLGYGSSLTALDAATGDVVTTYADTAGAEEIVYDDGVLFVVVGTGTDWATDQLIAKGVETRSPSANKRLKAIDAATDMLLWEKRDVDIQEIMPQTLAVGGDRVFLLTTNDLICLNRANGAEHWRVARSATLSRNGWDTATLVVYDTLVYVADRPAVTHSGARPHIMEWYAHRNGTGGNPSAWELKAYSTATGSLEWSCSSYISYNSPVDVLIADGLLWTGKVSSRTSPGITQGRNPYTGVVERTRQNDSTWITVGMAHHRCHRNKGTSNYLVLGRAGVEFADITSSSGVTTANHWVRGTCQMGVALCNGLLYAPPHSCACYQSGKLAGFNALAPEHANPDYPQAPPDNERHEEGPAYGEPNGPPAGGEDWPTYRHDAAREGYFPSSVSTDLYLSWQTQLAGKLTSPIIANGNVYVASVNMHTVHALRESNGDVLWSYIAGGRVDSPPTVYKGRVLFGSADGWVYCLRASDGALIWRFQAAPENLRMGAYGQLESVWPVPGNVAVHNGFVYFAAGRSSFLDGGIFLYKLDAVTGQKIAETQIDDRTAGGLEDQGDISGFTMSPGGALPDVLSCDGTSVFLRKRRFNLDCVEQSQNVPHIYSTVGFLDDTWRNRTYWLYHYQAGEGYTGWFNSVNSTPSGRLLVADDNAIYGFGRTDYSNSSHIGIYNTHYQIFSANKSTSQSYNWTQKPPLALAWGMVLTDAEPPQSGKTLFVAGTQYFFNEAANFVYGDEEALAVDVNEAMDAWECKKGGLLLAMSAADGNTLAEYNLEYPPVWDGMAAANGRLYLCLKNGKVQCFGTDNYPPIVDAGEDQTIYPMATALLDANVTDDGVPLVDPCDPCSPPIGVTTNWTKFDGPGEVSFDDPCVVDTNASFSQWGRYTLRLSAFDGVASNYDDTSVFVCRPGDMDCDNDVDIFDIGLFAAQWLMEQCGEPNEWCSGADQTAGGSVSFGSYAVVASNWLLGVEPAAPTNLVAVAGDSRVSLDWDDNTEADLAGYNVYRSTTSGSGYTMLNGSLLTDSNYLDTSVSNYITYYYAVTAEDISGFESAFSTEVSASPDPLPPNLVGWWKFDEGSGTTANDSGTGGNDGTISGATWVNDDPNRGTVLSFDGTDDTVDIVGYKGVTGTQSRTCCAWVKTTAQRPEIIYWGENIGGKKWGIRLDDGRLRVEVNGGYKVGSTAVNDDRWHHVAVVLVDDGLPDVIEAELYVDGALEAIGSQKGKPIDTASSWDVRIGLGNHGYHFDGLIDDVRIYDKALLQSELEAIMDGN